MEDTELKAIARLLLDKCKLSGGSIQTLTDVVEDGFVDETFGDPDGIAEGRFQRRTIAELYGMHRFELIELERTTRGETNFGDLIGG